MTARIVVLTIVTLIVSMSTTASADMYDFSDKIDSWGPLQVDAAWIGQEHPLSYTHDLNQKVDFAAGDKVVEAYLELDFTNDASDDYGSEFFGLIKWDFRENASYAYDGSGWIAIGEVDNGDYDLVLDVDWLNDDGMLDVTVGVSNPLGTATAWLDHSRLYGTAEAVPVPVPAAGMLAMLGMSVAGVKLRKKV